MGKPIWAARNVDASTERPREYAGSGKNTMHRAIVQFVGQLRAHWRQWKIHLDGRTVIKPQSWWGQLCQCLLVQVESEIKKRPAINQRAVDLLEVQLLKNSNGSKVRLINVGFYL